MMRRWIFHTSDRKYSGQESSDQRLTMEIPGVSMSED